MSVVVPKITTTRAESWKPSFPLLAVGSLMVLIGFCIYYLVPLSFLNMNLAILTNVFVALLFGILIGLVILSQNILYFVQLFWAFAFFRFTEHGSVYAFIKSNLHIHIPRNRKTSTLFMISVAFIIFANVTYKTEMNFYYSSSMHRLGGSKMLIDWEDRGLGPGRFRGTWREEIQRLEYVLNRSAIVKSWGFMTQHNENWKDYTGEAHVYTLGKMHRKWQYIYAMSPPCVVDNDFFSVDSESPNTLIPLYSARGNLSDLRCLIFNTFFYRNKLCVVGCFV